MRKWLWRLWAGLFALTIAHAACCVAAEHLEENRSRGKAPRHWPIFTLEAEDIWQLNPPQGERFDASALLITRAGQLLTLNDRGAIVYRIEFAAHTNAANLVPLSFLTERHLAPFSSEKIGRWDCEGLAEDKQRRLYVCEEGNRWILRLDPKRDKVERLQIDWLPVDKFFHRTDRNASFEGVAVDKSRLFVANERQAGRIIVVDLKKLKVIDHFSVGPRNSSAHDVHFSDLSWFDGALFALLRDNNVVLQIDPESHAVVAEYSFRKLDHAPEADYNRTYSGLMEGLAVDNDYFWLVADNNGFDRKIAPGDTRPTLVRCKRPDGGDRMRLNRSKR